MSSMNLCKNFLKLVLSTSEQKNTEKNIFPRQKEKINKVNNLNTKTALVLIIIPLFSFGQLDYNNYIFSNYIEELEWNNEANQFDTKNQMFQKVELHPEKSYYNYKVNYGETEQRFYWKYFGKEYLVDSVLNVDVYLGDSGEKIIFNYDDKEVWFFYDYNKKQDKYTKVKVLSNIKFRIKKSEYIPQTMKYKPQSIVK